MEKYSDIPLTAEQLDNFFHGYFSYYNTLDKHWQKTFVSRCLKFVSEKLITGAEGFKPDNKVKAIIAASAVQLTLGLEHWKLDYFDTIIIHPGDFENKRSGAMHRGETSLNGFIRLSWQSFISGYRVGNDNINLGLHEFMHALRFNSFRGYEQDYFVEHYFNRWLAAASEAYNDIRDKKPTVFRSYGGTNLNEFMCVCIEHFFESPAEIKEKYPALYYCTAILLNQQTINNTTVLDVREELLSELNKQIKPLDSFLVKTYVARTSSFRMMIVTAIPFLYTVIQAGLLSAASLILLSLLFIFYLRFDYNFIAVQFLQTHVTIKKGFAVFRRRRTADFQLSQLVSVRIEEDAAGSDWEIIFYNKANRAFYSEVVPAKNTVDKTLLRELWLNKVAVFKK